jgi:hypothetical protein
MFFVTIQKNLCCIKAPVKNVEELPHENSDSGAHLGTCPLGPDYSGASLGDITIYHDSPFNPGHLGACGLDYEYLRNNSDAYLYYAALPQAPTERGGKDQDGYDNGVNCGRCIKVS